MNRDISSGVLTPCRLLQDVDAVDDIENSTKNSKISVRCCFRLLDMSWSRDLSLYLPMYLSLKNRPMHLNYQIVIVTQDTRPSLMWLCHLSRPSKTT